MKVKANGIHIEVEDRRPAGIEDPPVVLLIMGLGMQLIAWPQSMIDALLEHGYRVVTFDNRDIGLSDSYDQFGTPNLLWAGFKYKFSFPIHPPYSLEDMAKDTVGVLEALQIEKVHVVGVSMGGMIAQRVALLAPDKVASLTSIMSSSGARGLPSSTPAVTRAMMSRPAGKGMDAAIDHSVRLLKAIGSPRFPTPDAELREKVTAAAHRSFHPQGLLRQMVAIVADWTRADVIGRITAPTLVIHGKADPLVPFACGEDTARRIPGARLVGIEGMGHDLPQGVVDRLVPLLIPHFKSAG